MITLSTHILDAVSGTHAANVEVSLFQIDKLKLKEIWRKKTDLGGRLSVKFEIGYKSLNCFFQLTFNTGDYFKLKRLDTTASSVSSNIKLANPTGIYHLPIIISPHGASLWWSG